MKKVYSNGEDWIVSDSPESAVSIWNDVVGDEWLEFGNLSDWKDVTEEDQSIFAGKDEETDFVPSNATKSPHPDNKDVVIYTATCGDWVEAGGVDGWWWSLHD